MLQLHKNTSVASNAKLTISDFPRRFSIQIPKHLTDIPHSRSPCRSSGCIGGCCKHVDVEQLSFLLLFHVVLSYISKKYLVSKENENWFRLYVG